MTRFVREGRGRKREHAVQLFGDSSTVAFNSWLRFTQRIFLHGTGEEEQEEEEEQQLPLARKRRERERESFSFAFRSCCSFFRLFRPNGQTSFNPPRLPFPSFRLPLFSPELLHHLRINWISFSHRCAGPGPTCSIKSLGKMS